MLKQHVNFGKWAAMAGLALGLFSSSALYAQITQVDYTALTGSQFVTFPPAGVAGTTINYDSLAVFSGVVFGEHFDGQTVTALNNFDELGGAPAGSLALMPGAVAHNLTLYQSPAGPVLSGVGTLGYPAPDAIGEGALSLLFSTDQSEFGFRLAGGNGGSAYVSFFRGDGSLIQSLTLSGLPLIASYGFLRDGGAHDIRGVSIWNDDLTGFGLSAVRHDVTSAVPEPATWAMLLSGFGAIGVRIRRGRRRPAQHQWGRENPAGPDAHSGSSV